MVFFDLQCLKCKNILIDEPLSIVTGSVITLECPKCKKRTKHKKIIQSSLIKFKGNGWTTPTHGAKRWAGE